MVIKFNSTHLKCPYSAFAGYPALAGYPAGYRISGILNRPDIRDPAKKLSGLTLIHIRLNRPNLIFYVCNLAIVTLKDYLLHHRPS